MIIALVGTTVFHKYALVFHKCTCRVLGGVRRFPALLRCLFSGRNTCLLTLTTSLVQISAVPLAQTTHDPAPETCKWLNALLQRVYLELHHNGLKQYVLQLIVDAFNSGKLPGFVVR